LYAQACQKEISQQKRAYERTIAEILAKQQARDTKAAKEIAGEALRSHPLAETPPRDPHTRTHASPFIDGPAPQMPVLRSRCAIFTTECSKQGHWMRLSVFENALICARFCPKIACG